MSHKIMLKAHLSGKMEELIERHTGQKMIKRRHQKINKNKNSKKE